MAAYSELAHHAPAFLLVLTRLGSLFMFAPLLTSGALPTRVKMLLALMFSLVVYPAFDWPNSEQLPLTLMGLAPLMIGEILVGAIIGLFAVIPLMSMQLAGVLMGQQMGLNLGNIVNPAIDIPGDNLGQLLFQVAIACFLSIGGMEVMWGSLMTTFDLLPPGGMMHAEAPLDLLVGLITSGFELALRIALPVVLIIFLENIAVGLIMKTVPSLNIMTFGFPIRIIVGVTVFISGLTFIREVIMDDLYDSLDILIDWANSLQTHQVSGSVTGSP